MILDDIANKLKSVLVHHTLSLTLKSYTSRYIVVTGSFFLMPPSRSEEGNIGDTLVCTYIRASHFIVLFCLRNSSYSI